MTTGPTINTRWADGESREIPTNVKWVHDDHPDPSPGALYYLWDLSGELVYVGETIDPVRRLQAHALKPWWKEIARAEVTWYLDQVDARRTETLVILERGPFKYCRQKPLGRYFPDDAAHARWLKRWRAERASGGFQVDPTEAYEEAKTRLGGTGLTMDDLIATFLRWFNTNPSEAFRQMAPKRSIED